MEKNFELMQDKNGRTMRTGDIVKIENAYFKNDNGYYFIDRAPGDVSWDGSGYSLKKIGKRGKISTAKYNIAFWPLSSYCTDQRKNRAADEHNKDDATIEIVDCIDNAEVIAHFKEEAEKAQKQEEYYNIRGYEWEHWEKTYKECAEWYNSVVERMTAESKPETTTEEPQEVEEKLEITENIEVSEGTQFVDADGKRWTITALDSMQVEFNGGTKCIYDFGTSRTVKAVLDAIGNGARVLTDSKEPQKEETAPETQLEQEQKIYKYGMRLRGFSIGCQPAGVVERSDDTTGKYWDIITYNRPLTGEEMRAYSLDDLNDNKINRILTEYAVQYERLYNSNNSKLEQSASAQFDAYAKENEDFVSEICNVKGDFISSDREAAALMIALVKLGYAKTKRLDISGEEKTTETAPEAAETALTGEAKEVHAEAAETEGNGTDEPQKGLNDGIIACTVVKDKTAEENNLEFDYKLILYKNEDFYGFGFPQDTKSFYGFPVNQCGDIEEVKESLGRWIAGDYTSKSEKEACRMFLEILGNEPMEKHSKSQEKPEGGITTTPSPVSKSDTEETPAETAPEAAETAVKDKAKETQTEDKKDYVETYTQPSTGQKIAVEEIKGKYYNVYGYDTKEAVKAGGFDTIEKAREMIQKHRPGSIIDGEPAPKEKAATPSPVSKSDTGETPEENSDTPSGDEKSCGTKTAVKYYEISEETARLAHEMMSFRDYKENSATDEYRASVDRAAEIVEEQKRKVSPYYHAKIDALLDKYARRLAEWTNAYNRNRASCPSVMICGSANFPTKKKERQNSREDTLRKEYKDIKGIIGKIKSVGTGSIDLADPHARELLQERLDNLKGQLELDKKLNDYWKKHKTFIGCPDISADFAEKLTKETNDMFERCAWMSKPFPDYNLASIRDKIKRTQARLDQLNTMQEKANDEDGNTETFDGGEIFRNYEQNRLQIIFNEKPDEETRQNLKSHGFRWSPRNKAWQRQLTQNAEYALKRLELAPAQ